MDSEKLEETKLEKMYNMELHETVRVDDFTTAIRVPGGWLYNIRRICYINGKDALGFTTTFVPDDY